MIISYSLRALLFASIMLAYFLPSLSIECVVGYGQRGKLYSNGMSWHRTCPFTEYCFEVITSDIKQMVKMIDFPWDPYFNEFYIQSCGGDFNTTAHWHPYRDIRKKYGMKRYKAVRQNSHLIKLNLTIPLSITGHGGHELFTLNWICRDNLCNSGARIATTDMMKLTLTVLVAVIASFVYL
jgi:hypothetical protein